MGILGPKQFAGVVIGHVPPPIDDVTVVANIIIEPYDPGVAGNVDWVLLSYKLPREPSNPRVLLWRKLRRLGAAQIVDGLVALPADARTREHFDWLADEIVEAGGEAGTWIARAGSLHQEQQLAARMAGAVTGEYLEITATAIATLEVADSTARRRTVTRLRRELRKVGARDFFPPMEREHAHLAVEELANAIAARVGASR